MRWWSCCGTSTRFPNRPDPSLGSAPVSRRLLPLAVLALAGLLAAGCADDVAPAARVGGATITAAELDAELTEWAGNAAVQDPEAPLPAAPGAFEGGFARGLLAQRIGFVLHNQEFEAQGLTVDDAMRAEVITVVFGDQATADAQLEGFSDEYAETVVEDLARQIELANVLGDDGYTAWRTEVYATTDIEVSPRFGAWDRVTATVTAPPAPLPGPAGT